MYIQTGQDSFTHTHLTHLTTLCGPLQIAKTNALKTLSTKRKKRRKIKDKCTERETKYVRIEKEMNSNAAMRNQKNGLCCIDF